MKAKKQKCSCATCRTYSVFGRPTVHKNSGCWWINRDRDVTAEDGTIIGSCSFCTNENVFLGFPLHSSVKEVLNVMWLCWECKKLVNHYVLHRHGLCYENSHSSEIEIAITDMLLSCLVGEIDLATNRNFSTNAWWGIRVRKGIYNTPHHTDKVISLDGDLFGLSGVLQKGK